MYYMGVMNLRFYLCEDCDIQLELYKNLIERAAKMSNVVINGFLATNNPKAVLEDAQIREPENLFFIDVNLGKGKMNGLELARKVKKLNQEALFIFITTEDFMAYKTFEYQLNTLDYIVKQGNIFGDLKLQEAVVLRISGNLNQVKCKANKKILIQNGSVGIRLGLDEIVGISTVKGKRQIEVQYISGCMLGEHSLTEIGGELDSRFFMVNKSSIVNLEHVRVWMSRERFLIMDNDVKYEVSFRKIRELKEKIAGEKRR